MQLTFDESVGLLVVACDLDDLSGEEVVWVDEIECPRDVDGDLVLQS